MYLLIRFVSLLAIGMALAWAGLAALMYGFAGTLAAIAVLFIAHRKWPATRIWYYLRHAGWPLPALAWVAGAGAEYAVFFLYQAVAGGGIGRVYSLLLALALAVLAAGCAYSLNAIFEGRLMKDIFSLVPDEQQTELADFLHEPNAAGAGGATADLSDLDPEVVAAAIKNRVVGQDEIIDAVVAQVFRRAALPRPEKPIATLMFVGATGAGKTELAKAMAAELFGGRLVVQRLNQLKSPQDVWSIVGPPPGYQGSDAGGKLCRDIGRAGTGVILLDEAEKCHPDVMQALMTLLDEGKLTEQSSGTTYSARGFLVVLTSNSAADEIAGIAAEQADPTARTRAVKDALEKAGWLPEILGRMDGVFPFPALDRESVARVVGKMVMQQAELVGVDVQQVDATLLIDLIKRQEKVARFGMRELDRLVETAVLDGMIAAKKAGATAVAIRVRGGKVAVDPVTSTATATAPAVAVRRG